MNWWERATAAERISMGLTLAIVFLTAVNVVATIVYVSTVRRAAKDSSIQTDKLICAAQTQAGAAGKFSQSADEIKVQITKAVGDFEIAAHQSANASQIAAKNTERTIQNTEESFREEQRAWLAIETFVVVQFERGKEFKADIKFVNSGRTPAINVEQAGRYNIEKIKVPQPDPGVLEIRPATPVAPQGFIYSHAIVSAEDITAHFDNLQDRTEILYMTGRMDYDDTSHRPHRTEFCFYMSDPKTKELYYCEKGNSIN